VVDGVAVVVVFDVGGEVPVGSVVPVESVQAVGSRTMARTE